MANFEKTFEELLLKLGLDSKDFQTEHTKVTNRAVQEATAVVNVYENLKRTFSEIPKGSLKQFYRQFQLGQRVGTPFSEEGGVVSYAGTPLISKRGTPYRSSAKIVEASTGIYRGLAKEVVRVKEEAISTVKALPGKAFKEEKEKLDIDFGMRKYTGMTSQQYNKAIAGLGKEFRMTNEEMVKFMKTGDGLSHTMGKIFKRAVETVPVWMAIRTVIQGTIQTISQGTKTIIDLDRELARIKTVTSDISESDMPVFLRKMSKEIRDLSTETGYSVGEIAHSFYGFKDAGLSTEVAMAGMNTAVKGSIALFGDLDEMARTLTDIYVQMGDRIEDAATPQEKMSRIMANIAVLQKTNKFEINEYNQGLKNFISAAGTSNLTLEQMTFLLAKAHTFMQRGGRGGTELARALREIANSAKDTGILLGSAINLDTTDKFTIMLNVMEALHNKMQEGKDITQDLSKIFGEIGTRAIASFVVNFKEVTKSWKEFSSLSPERKFEIWMDQFATASLTIERQVERFKKIRELAGANLIAGVLGIDLANTSEAAEGLKKINDQLENMIGIINSLGKVIRPIAIAGGIFGLLLAGQGIAGLAVAHPIIAGLTAIGVGVTAALEREKKLKEKSNKDLEFPNVTQGQKDLNTSSLKTEKDITSFYEYQSILKNRLKIEGYSQLDIERERLKLMNKYSESEVSAEKKHDQALKIKQLEIDEEIKDAERIIDYKILSAKLTAIYGKSEIDIQKQLIALQVDKNKIKDEEIKLQQMLNDEMIKYASQIQTSLSSSIKDMISGTSSLGGLFGNLNKTIAESYRTIVSEEMAKGLMATGIGEVFGRSMLGLKGQIEKGHESVYKWIVKGHQDAMSGKVSSQAGMTGLGGRLSALPGFGKRGWFSQPINSENYGVSGGRIGPPRSQSLTRGDLLAGGAQGLLTGYAAYQSGVSGGLSKGMAGASAGLTGIGSMLSMTPFAPLGWGLTALGTILQIFGKKKQEQAQVETKTSENKISSKIDVTNKTLEILNRNLIGLRQDMRGTYILPQSSYFSTKDSLEQEFSLSSRRGLV